MPNLNCGFDDIPGGATGFSLLKTYGPTINVDIGLDKNWKPGSPIPPVPGLKKILALIDTGATECCIDVNLATELNLPIIDRREIGGVGGKHQVNIYLAQIHSPELQLVMHGAFAGVNLQAGGQVHKVLMGRTFLQGLTLSYSGKTGKVVLEK